VVADKVMATCELIDARSSEVVWSDRIAVGVSDLVDPDSQLAQRLIEGVMSGSERRVIYPLRRVDCETGELIHR